MVTDKKINYGPLIKELRIAENVTPVELCSRVGISLEHLDKYESGLISPKNNVLKAIFDALGYKVLIDYKFIIRKKGDVEKTDDNVFGDRLRIIRQTEFHSSQKFFAEYLGISQPALSLYESGKTKPTVDILIQIADRLGTSIDRLCGKDEVYEKLLAKNASPTGNWQDKFIAELDEAQAM